MADLVTHIAIAHIFKRSSRSPAHPLLFALGTALPDVIGRAPGLFLYQVDAYLGIDMPYSITLGFDAFHMPVPYTLLCLFCALCVVQPLRRLLFWNLLLGGYLHFLLDLTQTHIDGGYRLFFPFSWVDFELGWVGSEDSLYVAIPLALLALVVEWRFRRRSQARAVEQNPPDPGK